MPEFSRTAKRVRLDELLGILPARPHANKAGREKGEGCAQEHELVVGGPLKEDDNEKSNNSHAKKNPSKHAAFTAAKCTRCAKRSPVEQDNPYSGDDATDRGTGGYIPNYEEDC